MIAYEVGGASETIVDGRTGVLFDQRTLGLAAAIERFEGLELDERVIRENAERFRAEMAGVIERAAQARKVEAA